MLCIGDVSSNDNQGESPYRLPSNSTDIWDAWLLVFISIINDLFNFICDFIFYECKNLPCYKLSQNIP